MSLGEPREGSSKPMRIIRSRKQAKVGWRSLKKGISKGGVGVKANKPQRQRI